MATTVILRLPEVRERVGLSRSQIYQLSSLGQFPKQIKLGDRASGWVAHEIDRWVAERIKQSRPEALAA